MRLKFNIKKNTVYEDKNKHNCIEHFNIYLCPHNVKLHSKFDGDEQYNMYIYLRGHGVYVALF